MPFITREELDQLHRQNDELAQQLGQFEEMRPHLLLAEELRAELVGFLTRRGDLDAREIGEQAYQNVLQKHVQEARDEVVASYEQQHRRSLYERLLGEVATTEGAAISEQITQKVETDPELAVELRDSARNELAARAKEVVRTKITAEQKAVIDKEADRQIELDRLDVRLALDGELSLKSEAVTSLVRPGDKLELFYDRGNSKRGHITLVWTKDVNDKEGWILAEPKETIYSQDRYDVWSNKLTANRFVQIGCVNKDLQTGKSVIQTDRLVTGLPIVLVTKGTNGKQLQLHYTDQSYGYSYHDSYKPMVLKGSDFQTKDLSFHSASAR